VLLPVVPALNLVPAPTQVFDEPVSTISYATCERYMPCPSRSVLTLNVWLPTLTGAT
jgi:hypothetical protein